MPTALPNDISLKQLNQTRGNEGRALRAYQDSVNVWTVGYGLTNFDKGLPWKVEKGLTITEEQAEWYLVKSLRENYLPAVKRALDGGTYEHPQGAVDCGADFHYNTGGIGKATWPKALAHGDLAAAKESLLSWNKAGGRVLAGLSHRRAANWLVASAEEYGPMTGPGVIEPRGENNREVQVGTGDILTAYPTDPGDTSAGDVAVDGVPQPTTPAPGVLKLGSQGPAVVELQNNLTKAGYTVSATGEYDQPTYDAVYTFQQAHPTLTADGKAGPATTATIVRAIAMRDVAGKVLKTATPVLPGIFIAFHQFVSANAGVIAIGVAGAVFVAVVGFYLWKHRHDAHGWFNSMIGRTVA